MSDRMKYVSCGIRSIAAARYAASHGCPGMQFDCFGRWLGLRLLAREPRAAVRYLLNPVAIIRYFEFSFVLSCLPNQPGRFWDISSPRLFGLYVANRMPSARILMTNPDTDDLTETRAALRSAGLQNVQTENWLVNEVPDEEEAYDCIWSISVFEHIDGDYTDSDAVRMCFKRLKRGGRLILTVPVDRHYREEFRDKSLYGTQPLSVNGRYFFQRFYDESAIRQRLLLPVGRSAAVLSWFGEKEPGRYAEYERRWIRQGLACSVEDPREITDHYQEYDDWGQMPGLGVCGLVIEKR